MQSKDETERRNKGNRPPIPNAVNTAFQCCFSDSCPRRCSSFPYPVAVIVCFFVSYIYLFLAKQCHRHVPFSQVMPGHKDQATCCEYDYFAPSEEEVCHSQLSPLHATLYAMENSLNVASSLRLQHLKTSWQRLRSQLPRSAPKVLNSVK